jgi:uncharacterized membrane protein SirB2
MPYLAVKHLHILFAILSGSLFLLRGVWMSIESPLLSRRWVKIVPHVIDTLLLLSAIVLAIWSRQYPISQNWLTAKVVALFVYIGLGTVAIKRGRTKTVRMWALIGALLTFAYIVAVAITKHANPLLS